MTRRLKPAHYARHRGVTRQAVHYALKRGAIKRGPDGLIDVRRADRAWAANLSPINGGERGRKGRPGKKRRVQASAKSKPPSPPEVPSATPAPRGKHSAAASLPVSQSQLGVEEPEAAAPEAVLSAGQGLIDAKTVRENWAGRRAELDYRHRAGELLDRAEVVKAITDGSRAVQEHLLGMVPRLSQTLAPEQSPQEMAVALREEITRALGGLTRLLARFVDGVAA